MALISAETSAGGLLWCFVTVCPWEVFCGLLWLTGGFACLSGWQVCLLGLLVSGLLAYPAGSIQNTCFTLRILADRLVCLAY